MGCFWYIIVKPQYKGDSTYMMMMIIIIVVIKIITLKSPHYNANSNK